MDPLSIATSATALATFAFRASKAIYAGIENVKNADATLLQYVPLSALICLWSSTSSLSEPEYDFEIVSFAAGVLRNTLGHRGDSM
jgi:hypothetical protein